MATATRRERSLIGIGIVVGIVVLGYVYVFEPLREWKRSGEELIPTRQAVLERRRLLVAQRPTLTAEIEQVNKRLAAMGPRWLKGPTPPLAASELQTLVKGLAEQAGAEVRSERILPLIELGGLQEVPIEITVASGLREAVRLLYDLEHTTKALTVQDVKVRVVAVGQARDLLTTFTVSGYLLPGAATPTAGESSSGSPRG
jgi:Type II secretion system (T2SS), protein M subtype b